MEVNIGIPVYNGSGTLGKVLETIVGQFPERKKILVVDDGSTDRSSNIALMKNVQVIGHLRNRGLAETRNTILKHSNCEILIFFDADAAPRPGCIEALVAPFADPRVVAVGGRGNEADCKTGAAKWRARFTPQCHGDRRIDEDWMVMGLCVAFRKQALMDVGGFDASFTKAGEDVDVSIRLRKHGGKLVYLPEAIVDHLPSSDLYDVTSQAYRHAKYASYALVKNGETPVEYIMDSAKCLIYSTANSIKSRKWGDCTVGALNMMARSVGIAAGMVKATKDHYLPH